MKVFTQADFETLARDDNGFLHLPSGDWSAVNFNGASKLIFSHDCILGDYCTLGDDCTLGDNCKLGNFCELGSRCKLGDGCKLGDECTLGDECKLGDGCSLANGKVQNATFFKTSNIGSRNDTAYCYCNTVTGDVYVRAGCWFSGVDDFIKCVRQVHAGTQHEMDYLAMAEFAKARFAQYRAGRNDYA